MHIAEGVALKERSFIPAIGSVSATHAEVSLLHQQKNGLCWLSAACGHASTIMIIVDHLFCIDLADCQHTGSTLRSSTWKKSCARCCQGMMASRSLLSTLCANACKLLQLFICSLLLTLMQQPNSKACQIISALHVPLLSID